MHLNRKNKELNHIIVFMIIKRKKQQRRRGGLFGLYMMAVAAWFIAAMMGK